MKLLNICIFLLLLNCEEKNLQRRIVIRGKTMGTTYKIILNLPENITKIVPIDKEIKKILDSINLSMSTYDPNSEISKINLQKHTNWIPVSSNLGKVLYCAKNISKKTHGYLDISIGRTVNFWGFGSQIQTPFLKKVQSPKSFKIDDFFLHQKESNTKIRKQSPETLLDVSSIAKGFAVDQICKYLEEKSLFSYMVEIGGELRVGEKDGDRDWSIGIQKPIRNSTRPAIQKVLFLSKKSLATSGNYQQFLQKKNKFISHIMDPKTGAPAKQDCIASISVLHNECMIADGFATALFAMPLDLAIQTCRKKKIDAYLIINKENKKKLEEIYTGNFIKYVANQKIISKS